MKENPSKVSSTGLLSRLGFSKKEWIAENVEPAKDISIADTYTYGAGITTVAALYGRGRRRARTRQLIYDKWMIMESDPIISSALMLLCTAALGGHETNGDLVFIEKTADTKEDKALSKIVDEISDSLSPIFNRIAFTMAYTGAAYGDSYARLYWEDKVGITGIETTELVRPQLVQPFERAGRTIGYAVTIGERNFQRLDITQLGRLKMPRTQWIPQFGVLEKSFRLDLTEDDAEKIRIMPSMVGGSLLYNAEEPWENLISSLIGLVGKRWMDSIDEQMVAVNLTTMTAEQKQQFIRSLKSMLTVSKEKAEEAVKNGRPILERIRHIIPVHDEKQVTTIGPLGQSGSNSPITIDDVMLHARLLAGALGVDLSMIGFADQLSGGLGEGGFFRTSAQAAERARIIRVALADFFNHVINIHTLKKYGFIFEDEKRPWDINFYGSISALESEKQRTRETAMQGAMNMVQAMQTMKELGADKKIMQEFLSKSMMIDDEQADLYSNIVDMKKSDENGGEGGEPNPDMGGGEGEDFGGF